MALRFDIGTLRPARRMSDGRLRADAYISRAGIFDYLDEDGKIRRELRPVEEVFHPDSMASFAQVPVTNNHPDVGNLDSKTARDYMVGSTGDQITRDPDPAGQGRDHVRASLMVADDETVTAMEKGKVETSSGYTCDVEEKSGVHPLWGRYDAVQRNIRGNHVAIVDSARAGRTVRVRMDGAATQTNSPARRGDDMDPEKMQETIRSLGAQLTEAKERADGAQDKLKLEQNRADVAEGRLLTLEARVTELQSQIATSASATETDAVKQAKERADAAEAKVARFDDTFEARVRARSKLERAAAPIMEKTFRMDDLSDREIMVAVVKRLDSTADVGKDVSPGVIEGRFLALLDGNERNAVAQARVAQVIEDARAEAPRADSATTRTRRVRDQWKKPLPNDIRAERAGKDT